MNFGKHTGAGPWWALPWATTGSLRPNVKPARKLTAEKASAADRALEEDLNILEKMKSSSNSDDATNTNLGLLSAELENTTTLLGDDARLNADTQIVKELKQTFSGRSDGAQRLWMNLVSFPFKIFPICTRRWGTGPISFSNCLVLYYMMWCLRAYFFMTSMTMIHIINLNRLLHILIFFVWYMIYGWTGYVL